MDTLFFIGSKLFWSIVRPDVLLTLLVALGVVQLYRGRLIAGRRMVAVAAIAMLTAGLFPVPAPFLVPLETRYPADPQTAAPDGIIILGGGELGSISAHWQQSNVNGAADRFLAGIGLAHRFPEAQVIFSGGNGRLFGGPSGAEIAQDLLLGAGVSADRLVLEGESRNTAENAAFTLETVPGGEDRRWILVTSAFHMHRAVGTFCAAGWRNIVPWPVDYRTLGGRWELSWRLAGNLVDLNMSLREWVGMLGYRATGRFKRPRDVPGCVAGPT